MSDYHVKEISKNGRRASVIFHIPIPIENNVASIALRVAVSEYIQSQAEDGSWSAFNSVLIGIEASELTQLRAGELYEISETVNFLTADTNGQKQTKLDNRYIALTISKLDAIRAILKFWGKSRDV